MNTEPFACPHCGLVPRAYDTEEHGKTLRGLSIVVRDFWNGHTEQACSLWDTGDL